MIRIFEAFAGYGTATFALKELGVEFELVGFSEIDKYAIQCFQQNHGGKNFGDITKINWGEVPDFDLLTGGFPCQAFSTAGKQLGEQDVRGVLGLELTRALIHKQPKYFLFENVKGFMSKKFSETREKFVKSWEDAGYKVVFKVLNTKDFGVPQNRERVFIIGIRKDLTQEFEFPKEFELKLKVLDLVEDWNDELIITEKAKDLIFSRPKNYVCKFNPDISNTIRTNYSGGYSNETYIRKDNIIRKLSPKEIFRLQGFLKDQINLSNLSDRQCYKLAGNGQSLNVVTLIFKELLGKEVNKEVEAKE